jgi:hypothetical protein
VKPSREPQTPAVDPEFAKVIAGLYYAFEDNLERCARLTRLQHENATTSDTERKERQDEALAGARRIAYVQRVTFEAMAHVIDIRALPPGALPLGVLSALARLAYALTALAEPEPERETEPGPEPQALLTQDEIRGLAHQYEIEDWVTRARAHNPDLPPAD